MATNPHNERWRTPPGGGLHSLVVNELGGEIVGGILAPGSVLNPNDIGERFDVSRSVVRESLRALESLGMVRARPQVGTRVMPQESWDLLSPKVVLWRGQGSSYRKQMTELLEMRRGVEGSAARLASVRMTSEEREAFKAAAEELARAGRESDGRGFVAADVIFHRLLLEGSHNAILGQFADTVAAVLHTRQNTDRRTITELTPTSVALHTSLAEALLNGDPDAAERSAIAVVESTITEFENLAE